MRNTISNKRTRHCARGAAAIALACALAALPARADETVPGPVQADVVKVVDGDTLTVKARIWLGQHVLTNVRIAGIDTPELHSKSADERDRAEAARAKLEAAVASGRVVLSDVKFDKYGGRVLAKVETDTGESVATLMLNSGLARVYDGGKRTAWCDESQAER